jgi:hypothetical protein
MRFYERQFENFNIYGVIKKNDQFIEIDAIDSAEKLHKTLVELRKKNELPDIVLLDLFYKRPIANVDELEKEFIEELLILKAKFKELKIKINNYLVPSGVELLKRLRLVDKISPEELPISVYTDKNFNFLLSDDFNIIYELAPGSVHKDRDFEEPNSMIPPSTEYFRILRMIEQSKTNIEKNSKENTVFISHGQSKDWMEVQIYLEKELGIKTIELAQEINNGRTIINKLENVSNQCNYAVVVMTGDDLDSDGKSRVRENVMHEIGYFQGKYGLVNVCLVYERGASIPNNLSGIGYLPYDKGNIKAIFSDLAKEIKHLKTN